ncbi:GatB/YqeY domain-containing protein [Bacillus sp. FSL L8-0099]|uniref:GatB/YqeY domain-containing protein n=1 Tax=unclassified Bacillus (in: firmicutes) TaxID=185979 RepID=UPI0030FAD66F
MKTIKNDMIQAMKDKDKVKVVALRMLLATFEKERIALKVPELNEDQIITCINREIKAIDQEIEGLVTAGRSTTDQEYQKTVLQAYLPEQLTQEEVVTLVTIVVGRTANMGMAMKELTPQLKGKADMKQVSQLVKEAFSK